MDQTQDNELLSDIFFPKQPISTGRAEFPYFAHYTSAAGALNILKSREIWLRSPGTMNDLNEIKFGYSKYFKFKETPSGKLFADAIESIFPGCVSQAESLLSGKDYGIYDDVYLLCISEHVETDLKFGKLSMWRAYGADSGAAIILKNQVVTQSNSEIRLPYMKVRYSTEDEKMNWDEITNTIKSSMQMLKKFEHQQIVLMLYNKIASFILTEKHEAFKEEIESRLIYIPAIMSVLPIKIKTEVIRGIPQKIAVLPLKGHKTEVGDTDPREAIHRILLGPSNYANEIRNAFIHELRLLNFTNPEEVVHITKVPLRTYE